VTAPPVGFSRLALNPPTSVGGGLVINNGFPVLVQKGGKYDFVYYESNEEGIIIRLLVQVNDVEGDLPIRTFKVVAKNNTTCTIPEYGSTDWQDYLQTN
jgi:hypothetical protein